MVDASEAPPSKQVNLRLVASEYAELELAARAKGLQPTRLARLLVRDGVTRIIHEERRDGRL
mgnify:CR=1 FL=1